MEDTSHDSGLNKKIPKDINKKSNLLLYSEGVIRDKNYKVFISHASNKVLDHQ